MCELFMQLYSPSFYFPSCVSAPGPVASLSGSPVSRNQVTLLWTPPLIPNGIITWYSITISSPGSTTTRVAVSSATRSHRLQGLHSNTQYTVTVAAVNRAGEGQATTITILTWWVHVQLSKQYTCICLAWFSHVHVFHELRKLLYIAPIWYRMQSTLLLPCFAVVMANAALCVWQHACMGSTQKTKIIYA